MILWFSKSPGSPKGEWRSVKASIQHWFPFPRLLASESYKLSSNVQLLCESARKLLRDQKLICAWQIIPKNLPNPTLCWRPHDCHWILHLWEDTNSRREMTKNLPRPQFHANTRSPHAKTACKVLLNRVLLWRQKTQLCIVSSDTQM